MGVATDVSPSVQRLRDALRDVPQGPIDNIDLVLSLLKGCWNELMGSNDTSMRDFKVDRAEQFSWRTPSLSFTIERHGATVVGSTRAELQNWTVNLDSASAYHSEGRFRQLVRQAPRLDVKSMSLVSATLCSKGRDQSAIWSEKESYFGVPKER